MVEVAITHDLLRMCEVGKQRDQGGVRFRLMVPELRLESGQFLAVVGGSGCGKSTLLDLLALVSKPSDAGEFTYRESSLDGEALRRVDVAALWARDDERALAILRSRTLGYVLQTGGLLPFLTVEQNIQLPLAILGERESSRVRELAERLDIVDMLSKKPAFLSGGQRQRVAIMRALIHRPPLVLADEPTAAVDANLAGIIVEEMSALARESGVTVVMVTHDRKLVESVADRALGFQLNRVSERETVSVTHDLGTDWQ